MTWPPVLNSAFWFTIKIDVCFNIAGFIWLAIVLFHISSYSLAASLLMVFSTCWTDLKVLCAGRMASCAS